MKDPRGLTAREVFLDAPDEALAAAAERILRASGFAVRLARAATVIEVDALRIDVPRHEVRVEGVPVPCTPTEFRVLRALAERVGTVVSYHVLVDRGWGGQPLDRNAYLRPIVSRLRRRLREARAGAAGIETIRGVGYRLRVRGALRRRAESAA